MFKFAGPPSKFTKPTIKGGGNSLADKFLARKAKSDGLTHEQRAGAEISETLKGFRERAKLEAKRIEDATDSEYWIALCFQTRAQKEEFLTKVNLIHLGDKYLDGLAVAQQLGVKLVSPIPKMPRVKIDKTWKRFIKKGGEE